MTISCLQTPFRRRTARHTALSALLLGIAAAPVPVLDQTVLAQTVLPAVTADVPQSPAEDGAVHDPAQLSGNALQSKIPATSDTAQLLDGIPGVSLYQGGGFSSLPVLRGLNDDRINTLVDGIPLVAACPNHMNPVLSYVQPASVAKIRVMAGATPVSMGGDSIAGTIDVKTAPPQFADDDQVLAHGSLGTFYKSVNRSMSVTASMTVATDWLSLSYTGSGTRARDYEDANGSRIAASSFRGQNHDVKVAVRGASDLADLDIGMQDLPYEGFPNQFMDMLGNQSRHATVHYQAERSWGELGVRAYWRTTRHFMDFLPDRYTTSDMPMNTKEQEAGYAVKGEIPLAGGNGTLRVGNEFHYDLMRDWWPQGSGMMSPLVFVNLNDASRNRIGTYVEWEGSLAPRWTGLFGVRNDTVLMNTGGVQGYSTSGMGSSQYVADSAAFNALDHYRADINFDVTAMATYEASATNSDQIGFAHKTRSPNFYERYAWSTGAMSSDMIGWFGDANGYVGSVSLRPEQANIISATAEWHDPGHKVWSVSLTPYYNYIRDYIGVDYLGSNSSMAPGSSLLQFANHDAMIYGIEMTGRDTVIADADWGSLDLSGTSSFQRGYQVNNGNSLYHMMPLNLTVAATHTLGRWSNVLEAKATASKSEADPLRHEPFTPGFAILNFRTSYDWQTLRLDAGIDNLLNQQYYSPLGGVDLADWRANGGSASTPLMPLAAPGRSFNAGVTVKF